MLRCGASYFVCSTMFVRRQCAQNVYITERRIDHVTEPGFVEDAEMG